LMSLRYESSDNELEGEAVLVLQKCYNLAWVRASPLAGALPPRDHRDGAQQDLEVEQQRPLADVLGIEPHHFLEVDDVAAPAHLPQAGNAGLGTQAAEVMGLIQRQVSLEKWPGAYQRHVPQQHVPQLRQLI